MTGAAPASSQQVAPRPGERSRALLPARLPRVDLGAALWPEDTSKKMGRWTGAGLLVLGTATALLRYDWGAPLDRVYAEDGTIFLAQAETTSFPDAFVEPYAGYMHAVPRLLAEVASVVPLRFAAAVLSVGTAMCVVGLALVVYRSLAPHVRSSTLRLALAAYIAILPVGREVVDVAANVHWYLLFAAFCVCLWRAPSRAGTIVSALVLLLTATSEPFAVVLLPLLALRAWVLRDRAGQILLGVFGSAIALQLWVMANAPERVLQPMFSPARLGGFFVRDVLGGALFGGYVSGIDESPDARSITLGVTAAAVAVVVACLAWPRTPPATRTALALVLSYAVALYVLPVALSGVATVRYAVPSVLLVVLALAMLIDSFLVDGPLAGLPRRGALGLVLTGVSGILALGWLAALPINAGDEATSWSAEVERAADTCRGPSSDQQVALRSNPTGWTVPLPCSAIPQPAGR